MLSESQGIQSFYAEFIYNMFSSPGGRFLPSEFLCTSAHLPPFLHTFRCYQVLFLLKKERRESQKCCRTRSLFDTVPFKEGGKRRIKAVILLLSVCLFVCLVAPIRIEGRAIADPRVSSAMKPDSWVLITLVGGLVLPPFF